MIDHGKKNVVGVMVDAVDYDAALARIMTASHKRTPYIVSALAVHGVMTGVQDDAHKFRLNTFDLIVPDGQPVRWALNRLHRVGLTDRVYGPDLTLRTLERAALEACPVYFYGSTAAILNKLVSRVKQMYPKIQVAGFEPSRFRPLDVSEKLAVAQRIGESGAAIVFVGLGCPRQEVFAFEMKPLLSMPILAVGAAFPCIAEELPQAPAFMQRNALEWLFRLAQEPRRLYRRYLLLNPWYLFLLAGQLAGIHFSTQGNEPATELRYG